MHRALILSGIAAAVLSLVGPPAGATETTNTFAATMTIQSSCQVVSTNPLAFGIRGNLSVNTDVQTTFAVQCANTTLYNVGLDTGSTVGGTVTTRLMTNGSATIAYQIYSDSGHMTNWGNTIGTDTLSGIGTGAQQTLTIYGRVAPQTTPTPSTYSDTVRVTVTY